MAKIYSLNLIVIAASFGSQWVSGQECKDNSNYNCAAYARVSNYCVDQERWTRANCAKSCGWCDGPIPPGRVVDGNWGSWTYGRCSKSCGGGRTTRRRLCDNPAPQNGGSPCIGFDEELYYCNMQRCPVHGGWSEWMEYSECTRLCGGGSQRRRRICNNPAPGKEGRYCPGRHYDTRACNTQPCPVHGHWSPWSPFGPCSKACGSGERKRERTCSNPSPRNGGQQCEGPAIDTELCFTECPVDGNWGQWSVYEKCSEPCGGGIQKMRRRCTNPAPLHGGRNCEGNDNDAVQCNTQACPVDGNWGQWFVYEKCSEPCGGGIQKMRRRCTNPAPLHGGRNCEGNDNDAVQCNTQACPVDGNWGQWFVYEKCSEPCGGGIQRMRRRCTNPAPLHGGRNCEGNDNDAVQCNTQACPVCEDRFSRCPVHKSQGYCSTNSEWMRVNCPRSCNMCEDKVPHTEGPATELTTQEPTTEVTSEPTDDFTMGPTDGATVKKTEQPTEELTEKSTQESTQEVTDEPIEVSTREPSQEPSEEPTQQSTEKSSGTSPGEPTTLEPSQEASTEISTERATNQHSTSTDAITETPEMTTQVPETTTSQGTPPVCEDLNGDCALWGSRGYCEEMAEWMKDNCPKSCKYCVEMTEAPSKEPTEATTKEPSEATTKEPTEAISKEPSEATSKEPTEATTKEPTEATSKEPSEATSKEPTEATSKEPTEATSKEPTEATSKEPTETPTLETTSKPTLKHTDKPTDKPTLGAQAGNVFQTTTEPGTLPDCNDISASCPSWSERGYCSSMAEWMKGKCPKSCKFCEEPPKEATEEPTTQSTGKTTLESSQESTEGTIVESTQEPTQETTGKSTQDSTEGTTAKSIEKSTERSSQEATGKSTQEATEKSTQESTEKSSGTSTGEPTTLEPSQKALTEISTERATRQLCPSTAAITEIPEMTTQVPEATTSEGTLPSCKDFSASCPSWSRRGFCSSVAAWMKANCPKSCKVCEELTEEPTEEITVGPTDEPTPEATQKARDDFTMGPTDEATVKKTEQPTEELTEKSTQESTQEVTDEPTEVSTREPSQEPSEEPTQKSTEKSSGTSTGELTTLEPSQEASTEISTERATRQLSASTAAITEIPEMTTQVPETTTSQGTLPSCKDFSANCPSWSRRGYCSSMAAWMKTNCPKSCKVCEELTKEPTEESTVGPTDKPTPEATQKARDDFTMGPTDEATAKKTKQPTEELTEKSTQESTQELTDEPIEVSTREPSQEPSEEPTQQSTERTSGKSTGELTTLEPSQEASTEISTERATRQLSTSTAAISEIPEMTTQVLETTTSPGTLPGCKDFSASCPYWSRRGYCSSMAAWMKGNCPKSCKVCEEATMEPTKKSTQESTDKLTDEPTDIPTKKPTDETTDKLTEEPTDKTTVKPSDRPTDKTSVKPSDRPTDETTDKTTVKPTDEPTAEPTEEPTEEKPSEQQSTFTSASTTILEMTTAIPTETTPNKVSTTSLPQQSTETTDALTTPSTSGPMRSCMKALNSYRTRYGVPELGWDQEISASAQRWAQHLHDSSQYIHDTTTAYGESLYRSESLGATCGEAAESWFFQLAQYDSSGYCDNPPPVVPPSVADFAQLMWRRTRKFGVGIVGDILVARYSPKGNIEGQVASNVPCSVSNGHIPTKKTPSTPSLEMTQKTTQVTTEESTNSPNAGLCEEAFNYYRKSYRLPSLEWSQQISDSAERWAQYLHDNQQYRHETGIIYGESLFRVDQLNVKDVCKKAAKSWFFQLAQYESLGYCDSPPRLVPSSVADFAQMMWRRTRKFGVGIVGDILVVRYYPKGNVEGQVSSNVPCFIERRHRLL